MMVVFIVFGVLLPIFAALLTWQLVLHTLPSAIQRHNERIHK